MAGYFFRNKDKIVAEFSRIGEDYDPRYELGRVYGTLPIGFREINRWLGNRNAARGRRHLKRLIRRCIDNSMEGIIKVTHCISINDIYWIKERDRVEVMNCLIQGHARRLLI